MTRPAISILIVEDDMIIAANISLQLTRLGYEVAGIIPNGEEALRYLSDNQPDILLLDINLRGRIDGIEVAEAAKMQGDTPIIFLTANIDDATFERAKRTRPQAFIAKPFKKLDLQRAIELTVGRREEVPGPPQEEQAKEDSPLFLDDRIFVRQKDKMVKIFIADILYAEAERNYCRIFTPKQAYLLATTLKSLGEKLPSALFLRIHRSYLINLAKIDAIGEQFAYVSIGKQTLPVSGAYQAALAKRLKTI
jgi:DNA-binding LytR/AlgR family response regulator